MIENWALFCFSFIVAFLFLTFFFRKMSKCSECLDIMFGKPPCDVTVSSKNVYVSSCCSGSIHGTMDLDFTDSCEKNNNNVNINVTGNNIIMRFFKRIRQIFECCYCICCKKIAVIE